MPSSNVLNEVEIGIETAEKVAPMLSGILSMLPPPFNGIAMLLQLLPVAAEAVQKIQVATGGTTASAITDLRNHMTAGKPAAPALSESA